MNVLDKSVKFILVGIVGIALLLRLLGLGTFMTADEPNWMIRSGEFWHNIARGDFGGTFRTSHPGVMTMWLSGAGIVIQEKMLGVTIDQSNLKDFRFAATFPIALATSILIGLITYLVIRIRGVWPGGIAGFLLAVDPYLTGMSQISHLDSLLALSMLTAFLFFLLYRETKLRKYLYLSGVFTGMAMVNKLLPALWLLPALVVTDLVYMSTLWFKRWRQTVNNLMTILGVAGLTIFLLWPAIWSMHNVNEYFERDASSIVTDTHIELEETQDPIAPASFYLRTFTARTPFFILLIGTVYGVMNLLTIRRGFSFPILLLCYVVTFLVFISLAAKKADRYALPALVIMPLLAGIALGALQKIWSRKMVVGVVAVLLIVQTLLLSPHTIAFSNSFLDFRPLSQQGWGEGLDEAATWLNERPGASDMTVASWYPSIMGTYFKGKAMSLSSRTDHRVGYVVTYRNMDGRDSDDVATSVLEEMRGKEPIHTVYISGVPYVWVYEVVSLSNYPKNVGEILPGWEVGQTITVDRDNWSAIDIGFATFNGRQNTNSIILHIKDSPEAATDLRTIPHNAQNILNSEWHTFTFDPIPNSAGKDFYISLTSDDSSPGNAVSVHFAETDLRPGQMLLRRRELKIDERNSHFLRTGDVAYRFE